MTTSRVIRLTAVVPCLLSLLPLRPYLKGHTEATDVLLISFFFFFLWGLGVFIGILASVIVKKPAIDPYFYLAGQLVIIVGVAGLWMLTLQEDRQRARDYGNVEDNERYIKWMVDDERREIVRVAYEKLAEKFSVNTFKLSGHKIDFRDTTVDNITQSLYTIRLDYYKVNDSTRYKSETTVLKDKAAVDFFDSPFTAQDTRTHDSTIREVKRVVRDAMKHVPDSIKRKMEEDFNQILEE